MKTIQIKRELFICLVIMLNLLPVENYAQPGYKRFQAERKLYLQPSIGLSQYYGDLNEKLIWNQNPKPAFGLILGYPYSPFFVVRGQFMKTNLNSRRADQNLLFHSNVYDVAINITISMNDVLAKYINGFNNKTLLRYYLISGAGMSSFMSKLNELESGKLIKAHGTWQRSFFLPLGAGVKYRINDLFTVNLEYCDQTIFGGTKIDFTDNVKKNNDHYSYASVGLQIRIAEVDRDNDGVPDKRDICPGLYGKVALGGCPDSDNDGIADKDDACPDVAGKSEFKGCPDSDNDGIIDREDNCPYTPGKKELKGCPDKDNDGVADKDDKCPDIAGKKELAGCPDADGDGIADSDDACPEVKGLAQFNGCPDTDGDGTPDSEDACPDAPGKKQLGGCPDMDNDGIADKDDNCPDVAGKKELAGCPDRDGDGVADDNDECPDVKGLAKFNGCPDTDGDGIPDHKDDCPKVAGVPAKNGCPLLTRVPDPPIVRVIYFNHGSSEVIPTFRNTIILDEIVSYFKEHPNATISVAGYEDAKEAEQNDLHLSTKRVDYVFNYLKQKGINSAKIKKYYLGTKNPAGDTYTAEGRTLNRRVEIRITK